jgi:hypothetical protein
MIKKAPQDCGAFGYREHTIGSFQKVVTYRVWKQRLKCLSSSSSW